MPKRRDIRARSASLRSRHTTLRPQGPDLAEAKASLASDMMKMSQRQAVAVYYAGQHGRPARVRFSGRCCLRCAARRLRAEPGRGQPHLGRQGTPVSSKLRMAVLDVVAVRMERMVA